MSATAVATVATTLSPSDDYSSLLQYNSYQHYLQSFITEQDISNINDESIILQLIELGYRNATQSVLSRTEFTRYRLQAEKNVHDRINSNVTIPHQNIINYLDSNKIDPASSPLLHAISDRYESLRCNRLCTILYIRQYNTKQQEVSSYIDVSSRLDSITSADYIFQCKPNDLSYYNYCSLQCYVHSNHRFQCHTDIQHGLCIKNKLDRKIININSMNNNEQSTTIRTEIKDNRYLQCVLFDHTTRRNN